MSNASGGILVSVLESDIRFVFGSLPLHMFWACYIIPGIVKGKRQTKLNLFYFKQSFQYSFVVARVAHPTAPGPYCPGVLGAASMDNQMFGINLMGISQQRCSAISTEFRRWFIEGNTNFGGEHFLITRVKQNLHFFYTI